MPRTKQKRGGGRGANAECEQAIRDYNRLCQLKIHQIELEYKSMAQKFDMAIEMNLNRLPSEIQNMTLRELVTMDLSPRKENLPPKTPKTVKSKTSRVPRSTTTERTTKRTTAASDDGYQSESMNSRASKLGPSNSKKRKTRSSSQDTAGANSRPSRARSISRDRQSKLAVPGPTSSKSTLKTPRSKTNNSFVITPKIKLNSAVNVLRKPKNGEMVFSTQGSPLLVSTTVNERTANVNVPLQNGNVMSLLPFNDTSLTENLMLDEETRQQLRVLQSHLAKVLK